MTPVSVKVVQQLTDRYGKKIAPHFQPIRENEKLVGYVNVIKNAGRKYTGIGQREEECEIPEYCKPNLEIYREKLLKQLRRSVKNIWNAILQVKSFLSGRDPRSNAYRSYRRKRLSR